MNDETQNQPGEDKPPLDEKKKTALLRYVAILFAVAFLFVLFSLILQMRNSELEISQLNQSALQNAEKLQDTNRLLQEENAALQTQADALRAQVDELEAALASVEQDDTDESDHVAALEQQVRETEAVQAKIKEAYELLLEAQTLVTPGGQEGNVGAAKVLENLKNLKDYLGEEGLAAYQRLLEEGE